MRKLSRLLQRGMEYHFLLLQPTQLPGFLSHSGKCLQTSYDIMIHARAEFQKNLLCTMNLNGIKPNRATQCLKTQQEHEADTHPSKTPP
jgi:hypothetical protein